MKLKMLYLLFLIPTLLSAQERLTVYFDFNKYHLNDKALIKLNTWIAKGDNLEVTKIYGFCDWKGTNVYNDSLSIKRVNTVFDFLQQQQIKVKEGYEIRGFGEDFEQSEVQSENRKVTIAYEIKKPEVATIVTGNSSTWQDRIKNGKTGDLIKLENINFYNMSARIVPKSKTILHELLCVMQDNPNLKIEIQGHICCQLSGDLNGISVSRAKAIYNFLIANKINRKRLSYKGYGVTKPIYAIPEKNEFEQDENRRVAIMIVEN
jgi:outer membrane protein OmpA-like peptidoglycan-associated protein